MFHVRTHALDTDGDHCFVVQLLPVQQISRVGGVQLQEAGARADEQAAVEGAAASCCRCEISCGTIYTTDLMPLQRVKCSKEPFRKVLVEQRQASSIGWRAAEDALAERESGAAKQAQQSAVADSCGRQANHDPFFGLAFVCRVCWSSADDRSSKYTSLRRAATASIVLHSAPNVSVQVSQCTLSAAEKLGECFTITAISTDGRCRPVLAWKGAGQTGRRDRWGCRACHDPEAGALAACVHTDPSTQRQTPCNSNSFSTPRTDRLALRTRHCQKICMLLQSVHRKRTIVIITRARQQSISANEVCQTTCIEAF